MIPKKIAFISSFLPRQCGIATYTSDLIENALKETGSRLVPIVVAMETTETFNYDDRVKITIQKDHKKDYVAAADYINFSGVSLVSLQHEFGLFGGEGGNYINLLLNRLSAPIVTTLHTVLEHPDEGYRKALIDIIEVSRKVVVMSQRGTSMLRDIYGIPERKIKFLPHGLPDLTFANSAPYKRRLGFKDRKIILTFGLLSRNKGIEWAIRALPEIIKEDPSILYIVLGSTHPEIKRVDGEEYRLFLQRLVRELDLSNHVVFINRFVEEQELNLFLNGTDYYLTPYLVKEQLTSGTLAFALGTGKAVISTPYWYAEELLSNGRGILVPFKDNKAISNALIKLIHDPPYYDLIRRQAYDFGREMTWPKVGATYWKLFLQSSTPAAISLKVIVAEPKEKISVKELPELCLDHFTRMTDDTGILQHAKFTIPNRQHGYCTDDNARALEAMARYYHQQQDTESLSLFEVYLAYLLHTQKEDGGFHNFMSFERHFLDPVQSDDATSRAICGLGAVIANPPNPSYVPIAKECFDKAVHMIERSSLRGLAYTIFGLADYLKPFPEADGIKQRIGKAGDMLANSFKRHAVEEWCWFEDVLAYDNGVLPHALFVAAGVLKNPEYLEIAVKSCRFLLSKIYNGTHFSFVGCNGWYSKGKAKAQFDQQPIDAASTVRMLRAAYEATGDVSYLELERKAFNWFFGENDLDLQVYDFTTWGCYDGLTPTGVNFNQGAESLISYMLAHLCIAEDYKAQEELDDTLTIKGKGEKE